MKNKAQQLINLQFWIESKDQILIIIKHKVDEVSKRVILTVTFS